MSSPQARRREARGSNGKGGTSGKKKGKKKKYTQWAPSDEQEFQIHPRQDTVMKLRRVRGRKTEGEIQAIAAAKNAEKRGKGRHKAYGKASAGSEDVHMKRTKTHTVNIFTSTARSLQWLEADAEVRRKYEEYTNASAKLFASKKVLSSDDKSISSSTSTTAQNDNEAKDGYRPYVPGAWLLEEIEQRLSLSEGKPKGEMSSHYGHLKATSRSWRALCKLYGMIVNPQYASKNMLAAASVNDALRLSLRQQGSALAMDNLAPLHWVAKDHFLCLLFAYYKFSPFEAHSAVGAVHDATLAERPWIERMLFRGSLPWKGGQAHHRQPRATSGKGLEELVIFKSNEARQRHRELLRMGTAVVNAVREDTMTQFSGVPIADMRASGDQHVLKLPASPTKVGGPASMLLSSTSDGVRPHIDDSLRVQDRRKPNMNPHMVDAGIRMDALRLEYPTRVDRRVIISRIRMLEKPTHAKANIRYAMEQFECGDAEGVRLRDFVQIVALPAATESDCQLAVAVREALLQRERDVLMFREAEALARAMAASQQQQRARVVRFEDEAGEDEDEEGNAQRRTNSTTSASLALISSASNANRSSHDTQKNRDNGSNLLDKVHPYHYYLEFLTENPVIEESFQNQTLNRLSAAHRARVLARECELSKERWDMKNEQMRRKKAMYYWVHASMSRMVQKWRNYADNRIAVRKSCEYAEEWYAEIKRKRGVAQWQWWVKKNRRDTKELQWAMDQYALLTFKHMFRRWKSETKLQKKLRSMQEQRVAIEYEHAMKNLIRLMDRTVLRHVKSSTFYSFSKWKVVVSEEILFEKSAKWWRWSLERKAFNRLRDEAWGKIEARRQLELDKNAIQEQMMEAAREGERLAEQARQEWEAEQAAIEEARLQKEADEQAFQDMMARQRADARRKQAQNIIKSYQREERLKQIKKEMDVKEKKHNGKWDSVEAGMADKARFTCEELFDTKIGKMKLEGITYDMIEEVAANIKTRADREAAIAQNATETPREGRPRWRVKYNVREATRYWYHKKTKEEVYPEFLTEYTSKSRKKGKAMAIQLYSDRQVVLARLKAIKLRNDAWDKEIRMYNAKRLTNWWKRMLKRKAVIELQWKADLQQFRVRKAKFHPAATKINSLCRVWLAHPWLAYMVGTQQGIQRIDSKVGPPYWFSSLTGESVWEPPTALSRLLERRLKARETLREERKHRMGKVRRRMKAKMSVQAQGIRMGGGKKTGVGNTDFL
jgi:hypothetical protein